MWSNETDYIVDENGQNQIKHLQFQWDEIENTLPPLITTLRTYLDNYHLLSCPVCLFVPTYLPTDDYQRIRATIGSSLIVQSITATAVALCIGLQEESKVTVVELDRDAIHISVIQGNNIVNTQTYTDNVLHDDRIATILETQLLKTQSKVGHSVVKALHAAPTTTTYIDGKTIRCSRAQLLYLCRDLVTPTDQLLQQLTGPVLVSGPRKPTFLARCSTMKKDEHWPRTYKSKTIHSYTRTPLSIGIQSKYNMMIHVIQRNTHLPVSRTRLFYCEQSDFVATFYLGERPLTDYNLSSLTVKCPLVKPGPIQLVVSIEIDGSFECIVRDQDENQLYREYVPNFLAMLSTQAIETHLQEAAEYMRSDVDLSIRAMKQFRLYTMVSTHNIHVSDELRTLIQSIDIAPMDILDQYIVNLTQ